jgi:hypothetical protein
MARTYKRKGMYNLWTDDAMKSAVDSVMRGNISVPAVLGMFGVPNTTLRNTFKSLSYNKIAKMIHLEKIEYKVWSPNTFTEAEGKASCDSFKGLS